jgi:hypothetical protein
MKTELAERARDALRVSVVGRMLKGRRDFVGRAAATPLEFKLELARGACSGR